MLKIIAFSKFQINKSFIGPSQQKISTTRILAPDDQFVDEFCELIYDVNEFCYVTQYLQFLNNENIWSVNYSIE